MNKILFIPVMFVFSLLFLGIGCVNTEMLTDGGLKVKTAETKTEDTASEDNVSGLKLMAETLGNGQVRFNWTKTDDIKTDRERGFVLVRSNTENPVHDDTNFWFRQSALKRENIWKDLPAGTQHFRICTLEKEKCAVYSNDVELDVK